MIENNGDPEHKETDSCGGLLRRLKQQADERRRLLDKIKKSDRKIKKNYATIISSLSAGKLALMTEQEIEDILGEPLTEIYELCGAGDLSHCRRTVDNFLRENFPTLSSGKCIIAIGEAMNNAVKHADGGKFQFFRDRDILQFMIEDCGPGIDVRTLPKATLTAGFSTAGTTGLGFTIMLEQCSAIALSSRPGRTVLVLENDL